MQPTSIIVHPHNPFSVYNGGIMVMYKLAQLLNDSGVITRLHQDPASPPNPICNLYYNNEFDITSKDTVAIYCEAVQGNPLNAGRCIRWMLSKLGRNVGSFADSWGANDLVYYYNAELHFPLNEDIYKTLSIMHIPDTYVNKNQPRRGTCYLIKKGGNTGYIQDYPQDPSALKPRRDWFKLDNKLGGEDGRSYIDYFNQFEYFVSYDPMTFTNIIAALCGCVSIVSPSKEYDERKWLRQTCFGDYLAKHNLTSLNGITYGWNNVARARASLPEARAQIIDMVNYYNKTHIANVLNDILNWDTRQNTVYHNFHT